MVNGNGSGAGAPQSKATNNNMELHWIDSNSNKQIATINHMRRILEHHRQRQRHIVMVNGMTVWTKDCNNQPNEAALATTGESNNQPNDGAAWRLGAMVNGNGNGNGNGSWSAFHASAVKHTTINLMERHGGMERHGQRQRQRPMVISFKDAELPLFEWRQVDFMTLESGVRI